MGLDPRVASERHGAGSKATGLTTSHLDIITIEPGKRGGRPVIRGLRITVGDILGWLAAGMTPEEIVADLPELEVADIRAALAFAADRERRTLAAE